MKHKESGSTVVLSMIVIVVLAMCVAGALDYTTQTYRDTQQANARSQAVAAATGALDLAYVNFVAACRANENVALSGLAITSGTWSTPTYGALTGTNAKAGSFMNIPGVANPITVTIKALDATNPNAIANPLASGSAPIPSEAGGITMGTWSYLAQATASYQTLTGVNTVTVSRIFEKTTESPWQYAIFYNDDLEANPGSTMNVVGAVQTNGNLYTGGEGGDNYLIFKNSVNYAGPQNWDSSGQYDPNDQDNKGDATAAPTPPSVLPTRGPSELPQNSALLGNTTGATNPNLTDGYHEIIEPPSTAINPATGAVWVDPLASTDASSPSERYYYQAGVKILLTGNRSSPTVSVLNLSGSTVTSASTGANKDIYSAFSPAVSSPAVTTNGNLYDNRQGALIPLTTIDISKILSTLNTGGALAQDDVHANIVYIDDETSAPGGVELINGSTIPANGLTVVSANPVYIQGDYNTGGTGSAVGSNSGSPTVDYVSGYTPQPCAVMADAVTILSNSWVNSSSSRNGNVSNASNTTINTAILSGIVMPESTNSATYSGAVENFPRLLENWDSRTPQNTFTYFGSMVELFQSRQATGIYQEPGTNSPHYYGIPIRQWYFDTRFYSAPPPGTFKVITYIKSRWFIQ